jgi:hypothetical protein
MLFSFRYDEDEVSSADDTPLNLSSGSGGAANKPADSEESGGLRLRGNQELLQNPSEQLKDHQREQQQALYNQHAAAAMGSQFGLPPHFLFPFTSMPGMLPSGATSRSQDMESGLITTNSPSGGRSQIFNIEAYCKLCNKEFCNKYFLKTHMANKHGIYSENGTGTPTSSTMPRFDSPSSMSLGPPPPSSLLDRMSSSPLMNVSLPTTPVSISGSFMAMASSLQQQQQLQQQRSRQELSETSPKGSPSAAPNQLGGDEDKGSAASSTASPKPRSSTPDASTKSHPPPLISNIEDREREPGEKLDRPGSSNETDKLTADIRNSLPPGLRLPMVPPHMNPFGPLPFFNMSPSTMQDIMRKEEEKLKEGGVTPTSLGCPLPGTTGSPSVGGGQSGGSGSPGIANASQDRLRQMGVINADAFCEYCCKEFCNKYFLRVHKLKKHGVCSPELPPEKVQKILAQMAKEAGKTGQPMPPLTLGGPPLVRPPTSLSDTSKALSMMRQPGIPNFLNLPPLDPAHNLSIAAEDSDHSSDRPDEREEGRQVFLSQFSPRSIIEPECELKIDENSSVIKSPLGEIPREKCQQSPEDLQQKGEETNPESTGDSNLTERKSKETNEGLANLQNMIMKLNSSKSKQLQQQPTASQQLSALSDSSSTVCRKCNKDMENKYFLHAHMMNEHGTLNMDEEEGAVAGSGGGMGGMISSHLPISLPQYPADLSKLTADLNSLTASSLGLPCPISTNGGLPKLSEKPMDYGKSIFEQMQGIQRGPSFLEQMKNSAKMDLAMSPLKRTSMDRDPNKKPASLSRSYCEICKKELCNKYFMKTHMMKMHGIMMDPGPPASNTSGGHPSSNNPQPVSCEICKKEMSSRYFLMAHMASVHGLNEDMSPLSTAGHGGMMSGMFPGLTGADFPPAPRMGEFSRLLMQQGEKTMEQRLKELDAMKESAGHTCSLCSNVFPDIVSLQVNFWYL